MLTSITPLGERSRGNRYAVTLTAYVLGCLLGGATTGLVLGAVGSLLPSLPVLVLAAIACAAAALADLRGTRIGRRQVDEDWLTRYRGWVYGLGFGYQLGLGVVTVVTSAATVAVLALALLTQSAVSGLLVGLAFGGARAVPALLLGRAASHGELRSLAAGLERRAPLAARTTTAALALGSAVLLTGALA
ncbi:MAG: hypothetical protein JWM62_455 [Frankiales bacterium]|nr:hypothetical protein [Frankiales bacterium]